MSEIFLKKYYFNKFLSEKYFENTSVFEKNLIFSIVFFTSNNFYVLISKIIFKK